MPMCEFFGCLSGSRKKGLPKYPNIYYFRTKKNVPLPGLSTLRTWAARFCIEDGILFSVLSLMKAKGDFMNETEKLSVICFDESYVSNKICFDKKNERVIGPQKCIQTVIVRGLVNNWKQPIYYGYDKKNDKRVTISNYRAVA
ncbi:unnamed protein product [Macrosiphum euphorbiae]|uniref:Transposase n=1 Tax=Macrosiphum euphorbiae TaxID=13131 RepID=A0AAV0XCA4_9HEMI|nr:unnamed protein product [Macrosiphum euphorbiae]